MESEKKLYISGHGNPYWLTEEDAKRRNITAAVLFLAMVLIIIAIAFWAPG